MPLTVRLGNPLHYDVLGAPDAPPLLLIMGLSFSSRAWGRLPERLSASHRVITFDNRGTGRSQLGPNAHWPRFRVADLAEDALSVLDAAGVSGPADVFGISMGGLVAQELALRFPARVRALALGATYASFLRGERARLPALTNLVLGSLRREKGARHVEQLLVSRHFFARHRDRVRDWLRTSEPAPPSLALAQVTAAMGHEALSRLGALSMRSLVITGDEDQIIPASNSARIARALPNAELRILCETGHAFPLEREEETVEALQRFFTRTSTGRSTHPE